MAQVSTSQRSALRRWRRLVGRESATLNNEASVRVCVQLRPRSRVDDGLVNITELTAYIVYEELSSKGTSGIHVAEFSAKQVPWGVRWGSADRCHLVKNLRMRPRQRARRERFDLNQPRLLHHALDLYDTLRCARPAACTTDLRIPDLGAAVAAHDSDAIQGDGPELVGRMHEAGLTAVEMMARHRREFQRFALYPLAWVSHLWERFDAVYADMSDASSIQVVQSADLESALTGFRGACEFDFRLGRISQESRQPQTPHVAA